MTYEELKNMRAERAKAVAQAGEILSKAAKESRDLTGEEQQEHTRRLDEADAMKVRIDAYERQLFSEASVNEPRSVYQPRLDVPQPEQRGDVDNTDAINAAIRSYIVRGYQMPDEQRRVLEALEVRAMSQAASAGGGYLVAPNTSLYNSIAETMKTFGAPEVLFDVMNTDDTGDMPVPTNDDTSNVASSMQENVALADATDLTIGQVTLYAHLHGTGVLKVSNKLLTGAPSIEAYIGKKLGERIGRRRGALLTTGTGTAGQPKGLVTCSTLGKTATAQSAITFDEILDLQHAVDPAYRSNATFMCHDSTVKALRKLVDGESRPLYQPGYAVGAPDTLLGQRLVINNHMDELASGKKVLVYGDFSKFIVRNAGGLIFRRADERYVELFQTGFVAFWMFDSNLPDTAAVKHLITA